MGKLKVIFLDIDGVLNVIPQGRDKYGSIFHQNFIDNLERLINETDAKIVISSTWRFSGLESMQNMWKDRNLPGEVIDITPDCADIVESDSNDTEFYDLVERGHEINEWLKKHPEVEKYVILDDDNDMLKSQQEFFVRTVNNDHPDAIDIGYGLTKKCTDRAINILNT